MCLLALSWRQHPHYPLLLAGNRDEFHARPTRTADYWPEHPQLIGGKDLQAGGGWLLASREGRWAALTNVRDGRAAPPPGNHSRGELVLKAAAQPIQQTLDWLQGNRQHYAGFNLLWGDSDQAWYCSNQDSQPARQLQPGLYLLSNAALNTCWPKTRRLQQAMQAWLAADRCHPDTLFATLLDQTPAADGALPDTHVGLALERLLSPVFIAGTDYGTRASTLLWQDHTNRWFFHERSYSANRTFAGEHRIDWQG